MIALRQRSETVTRPRFEGTNIGTWVGFKHVLYLLEEAVLDHLRASGCGPRALYEEHGLAVEIVDCDARILSALRTDDLVTVRVEQREPDRGELTFAVACYVDGVKTVSACVRLVLRRCGHDGPAPEALAPFVVDAIDRPGPPSDGHGHKGFEWRKRIPYFYCHYSERLQHSGYVRIMEEVVDLFLAGGGISIRTMLDGRRWIPVVPHVQIGLLGEAAMEEELRTVFTVEEVFKDFTYTARMDCYVPRGDRLTPVASGRITHGYAEVRGARENWGLIRMDQETLAVLRRGLPGGMANGVTSRR
ncbi:MAG TPA: hypothetical protein VFC19_52240 [Candidatus Limnocylindrales bacterium]|nr:hypothetical protein [Candidatus Limnocylindrales bacterium]